MAGSVLWTDIVLQSTCFRGVPVMVFKQREATHFGTGVGEMGGEAVMPAGRTEENRSVGGPLFQGNNLVPKIPS